MNCHFTGNVQKKVKLNQLIPHSPQFTVCECLGSQSKMNRQPQLHLSALMVLVVMAASNLYQLAPGYPADFSQSSELALRVKDFLAVAHHCYHPEPSRQNWAWRKHLDCLQPKDYRRADYDPGQNGWHRRQHHPEAFHAWEPAPEPRLRRPPAPGRKHWAHWPAAIPGPRHGC